MSNDNVVLVLGAGADKTKGIDFPIAADLLSRISVYLNTDEGKAVEKALRDSIPNLTFRFDKFINNAISEIAHREPEQLKRTVARVQEAVTKLPDGDTTRPIKKQGQLIIKLFNQLQSISETNAIDEETRNLIREVFGDQANEFDLDDHILNLGTMSVSDTFKAILRYVLKQSLEAEANDVARALGADMLDIEQLLVNKFLGFYNNKLSDIKSYVYISWCLWAFLSHKDKEVKAKNPAGIPFYANIPSNWKAITLNYTSFLQGQLGTEKSSYFHGGLLTYVRMDNRELLRFDQYEDKNPAELLEEQVCPSLKFDKENPANSVCLIPSFVPPLRLKPILSHHYIKTWYSASDWLEKAEVIVIVGYSLNSADEHFNDILRSNSHKKTIIINPDAHNQQFLTLVTRIYGIAVSQLTDFQIQGCKAKKSQKLILINAYADGCKLVELPEMYQ